MNSERIKKIVEDYNLPKYSYKQLEIAFFDNFYESFLQVSTIKKAILEELESTQKILTLSLVKLLKSSDKRTYKAILKTNSNHLIETVLMSPKSNLWTVCISSQVGCAVGCTFCATGKMGLLKNLTSEEISDQVLFWQQFIQKENLQKLNNIVYMGMGEPFHNRVAVFDSIRELTNSDTFNFGYRHISISTSGILKGVKEMQEQFPQVNLALSLHSANNQLRSSLVPINNKHNLDELRLCIDDYLATTNRKIFVEYVLLDNENDKKKDSDELIAYIKKFKKSYLLHINLIVYNPTDSGHFQSSKEKATHFKNALISNGISCTIRKNLGRDIDSACGQLITEN